MKPNRILYKIMSLTAMIALMLSCSPEVEVKEIEPVFPSLVENYAVSPGEVLTITFIPNMDWTVSIPDESLQWFPIMNGSFKDSKISGKPSETPVSVKIQVSSVEEIGESRSVDVSMTMGNKTQVIAKYMRPAKEPVIKVFSVKVEDDEFLFDEDASGNYAYNETEAEVINMLWPVGTNGFRTSIKIESNFEWVISLPEWADADIPESTVGETILTIVGEPSKYPLEGGEGKLQFKLKDEVVKQYKMTIPPCNDKLSFSLSGVSSLIFNGDGDYAVAVGYEEAPAKGNVFGPKDIRIFALVKTEDGYSSEEADWVTVKLSDWDADGDVLQTRTVEYSVSVNDGDAREAAVFILPATFKGSAADVLTGNQIKEEYQNNFIPVLQYKRSNEFMTPLSDSKAMASVGAYFNIISGGNIKNWFGATDYAYKMVYSLAWSLDEGWLYLKRPFTSYKVFDSKRNEVTGDFWLGVETTENMRSVRVVMNTEEAAAGYVAFYDGDGNNMGVISCEFDPTRAPQGSTSTKVEFIGESASYAEAVGATLEEITDGELFDGWKEYNAPIYHLTYKIDNMPMRISLPSGTVYYNPNPYKYRNCFRVNDLNYDESVGDFSYIDGGVDIYMSLPEDMTVADGAIIFSRERGNTTDAVSLVLLCTLDMSE